MTQQAPDKINVFWFLPTHGDGRYLGTTEGGRPVDLPYLQQVALAADSLGYYGVLIPTGKSCEDSWLVASALAPLTRRLRYLVAVRPPAAANPGGADGGHPRPFIGRSAADQRRYRRRPGGKQRRRYLPQPQRALSGDPRIS